MLIGCQIKISTNLLDVIKKAKQINCDIVQTFLTINPHSVKKNTKVILNKEEIKEIKLFMKQNKIKLIIHSNYLLNYCSAVMPSKKIQWAVDYYLDELQRGNKINAIGSILHIGSKKELTDKIAYSNFVKNIKYIIKHKPKRIKVILELTAGGGSKIGYTIQDFSKIWNKFTIKEKKHLGICLDTAHIFLSGYQIHTKEGLAKFSEDFQKKIGFNHVILLHLNDAKFECGSHRNVHTNLMNGYLFNDNKGGSFESLITILDLAKKYKIDLILETGGDYNKEIKLIKSIIDGKNMKFNNLRNKCINITKNRVKHNTKDNIKSKIKRNTKNRIKETTKNRIQETTKNSIKQSSKNIIKRNSKNNIKCNKEIRNLQNKDLNLVVNILKEVSELYKVLGDEFRHKAYRKAYLSIKKFNGDIETNKIEGVGKSILEKIKEIKLTGNLKLLNELKMKTKNIENLQKIDGIGPIRSKEFKNQGILTINQLRKQINLKKIKVDKKIKLSLNYYNNLQKSISIDVMNKYLTYFKETFKENNINCELVGSYKTGKAKQEGAHDIDILISYTNNKLTISNVLKAIEKGVVGIFSKGLNRASLLMKLTEDKYVRHVDILITSKKSHYPALLYFGSGVDTIRQIRQIAKKKGYKLNEYELLELKTGKKYYSKKDINEILNL